MNPIDDYINILSKDIAKEIDEIILKDMEKIVSDGGKCQICGCFIYEQDTFFCLHCTHIVIDTIKFKFKNSYDPWKHPKILIRDNAHIECALCTDIHKFFHATHFLCMKCKEHILKDDKILNYIKRLQKIKSLKVLKT